MELFRPLKYDLEVNMVSVKRGEPPTHICPRCGRGAMTLISSECYGLLCGHGTQDWKVALLYTLD